MYSKRPFDNAPYQGAGGYPGGGVDTKRYKPQDMISAGIYGEYWGAWSFNLSTSFRESQTPSKRPSRVCRDERMGRCIGARALYPLYVDPVLSMCRVSNFSAGVALPGKEAFFLEEISPHMYLSESRTFVSWTYKHDFVPIFEHTRTGERNARHTLQE